MAAVVGVVAMLNRKVTTHDLLKSGAARRLRTEVRALFAELVGDRGGDEVFLGGEVCVEGAIGQPRVRHERGDPRAVDAVSLEPTAGSRIRRLVACLCSLPYRATRSSARQETT